MKSCVRLHKRVLLVTAVFSALLGAVVAVSARAELDLRPLPAAQWSAQQARHLGERAAFGLSEDEVAQLASMTPEAAARLLVEGFARQELPGFDHSGVFDAGLDPFPPSRPAATRLAQAQGHALGVQVKPAGNRPLQPVVNRFFYWLRASRLETDRVAWWWAERMLTTRHPLQEKMALFWHGHFATNEDKVRDYRKMLGQLELFQARGLGGFRELLVGVAQDPAMLVFLDAGVNTNDSPNENFAREIMELFTMGVGHYTERDVQEAARAFTGWNVDGLTFKVDADQHDDAPKTFLGHTGRLDGVDVIDIILDQPVTASFIAAKLYRYFVNEDLAPQDEPQLGELLRANDMHIGDFLAALFASRDFYSPANVASRIKPPVELIVSTYRRLGFDQLPGVPDFNVVTGALGQRLMHPPTVAGWSQGRAWITPSLMFERANFVLDVLFPPINFIPPDRFPPFVREVARVQDRLREGLSVSEATRPTGMQEAGMQGEMAASNLVADRDEAFNTRLGSMRGWQMALERVKPIPRPVARLNLTAQIRRAELAGPREVVAHFARRFIAVQVDPAVLDAIAEELARALGTHDLRAAESYAEEPLRQMLHRLLSLPEYQLG